MSGRGPAIDVHQVIAATPGALWQACSTPEGLAGWQADEVEGRVEPGEQLRLRWPALGAELQLQVVERVEGRRVVLRDEHTTLSLELEATGLRLRHDGLPAGDASEGVRAGWRAALAVLAHGLQTHPGRARRTEWWQRTLPTTPRAVSTALLALMTRTAARREPRVPSGSGDSIDLELGGGHRFTGVLLGTPEGRDLVFTWREQADSAVTVRTLGVSGEPERRIVALTWSRWDAAVASSAEGRAALDGLLEALCRTLLRMGAA